MFSSDLTAFHRVETVAGMNFKLFETFIQVAECGSLSRAADTLGVAQSIVSRNIAKLEALWHARLFDRTGRGVVATEFGRAMMPEVAALLRQFHRVEEVVRDQADVLAGVVRVGIIPSMARMTLPTVLQRLQECAPQIRMLVFEGRSGHIDDWLHSGRIDMAVVNRYELRGDEDRLGEMGTYLVCSPTHKFARQPTVTFQELADLRLVLPPTPSGLRTILDQHARGFGLGFEVVAETESLAATKEIVMSGRGMTVLPLCAVYPEVSMGRLAAMQIVEPAIPRQITLATTHRHTLSRSARYVMTTIRDVVSSQLRAPDLSTWLM